MAAGESSTAAQTSEVLERLAEREKELAKMEELVRSLDDEVKRERERTKDAKKQVFNEIAIQGTPQMAADQEAISLSGVYSYYSACDLPLF